MAQPQVSENGRSLRSHQLRAVQGISTFQYAKPWNGAVNHMGTPMCTWLILTECFSLAWWPKWRILVTMNYLNMNKYFEIKPRCLVSLPAYNGWHGYLEKKKFRFKPSFFKISGDFKVVELHVIPHLHLPNVHIAFWFSLALLSLGSAMCQLLLLHCTWAGSHFASLIPGLEEQSRFWWLLAIFYINLRHSSTIREGHKFTARMVAILQHPYHRESFRWWCSISNGSSGRESNEFPCCWKELEIESTVCMKTEELNHYSYNTKNIHTLRAREKVHDVNFKKEKQGFFMFCWIVFLDSEF